jgi:hypothetical protein
MAADASVFLSLWLQKPLGIAAANPSGGRLADAVAVQVDFARPGPVRAWGAGTGSLTRPPGCTRDGPSPRVAPATGDRPSQPGGPRVIRGGCPPERIIALEREPALTRILRRIWFNLLPAQIWCYWDRTRSLRGGQPI